MREFLRSRPDEDGVRAVRGAIFPKTGGEYVRLRELNVA